jgi:hypothetical protein
MAKKKEMTDEELLKILQGRLATPAARMAVAQAIKAGPKATRADLTSEFNQELREEYKRGPRARGDRFFNQEKGSPDFEKLRKQVDKAPERVKKLDQEKVHRSRQLHREFRARTKGAQFNQEQHLRDYMRMVEEGYVKGGGKLGARTIAKKLGAKALFRGAPILGAGYAGFKIGTAVTPAAKRNEDREARREVYEQRQERMRDVFPGKTDDFYRRMAQQMGKEDESGHKVKDAEEVLRIFELQKEIDSLKNGPGKALVREVKGGRK